jgi:hypothetical protein
MAPLLPKLRGHFAEFLNHSYLDRLSILYLTTCVGLGYGPCESSLEAFLGSIGSPHSPHTAMHHVSGCLRPGFTWTTPYTLTPVLPLTGAATFLRHPIAWLLPARVPRSATPATTLKGQRQEQFRAVSITGFTRGALTRVREYQPVVHRLRLSASP